MLINNQYLSRAPRRLTLRSELPAVKQHWQASFQPLAMDTLRFGKRLEIDPALARELPETLQANFENALEAEGLNSDQDGIAYRLQSDGLTVTYTRNTEHTGRVGFNNKPLVESPDWQNRLFQYAVYIARFIQAETSDRVEQPKTPPVVTVTPSAWNFRSLGEFWAVKWLTEQLQQGADRANAKLYNPEKPPTAQPIQVMPRTATPSGNFTLVFPKGEGYSQQLDVTTKELAEWYQQAQNAREKTETAETGPIKDPGVILSKIAEHFSLDGGDMDVEKLETVYDIYAKDYSKTPRVKAELFPGFIGQEKLIDILYRSYIIPKKYPEAAKLLGVEPINSLFLYGSPGVGKTMIMSLLKYIDFKKETQTAAPEDYKILNLNDYLEEFKLTPDMAGGVFSDDRYAALKKHIKFVILEAALKGPILIIIDDVDNLIPQKSNDSGRHNDDAGRAEFIQLLPLLLPSQEDVDSAKHNYQKLQQNHAPLQDQIEAYKNWQLLYYAKKNILLITSTNLPRGMDVAALRPGRLATVACQLTTLETAEDAWEEKLLLIPPSATSLINLIKKRTGYLTLSQNDLVRILSGAAELDDEIPEYEDKALTDLSEKLDPILTGEVTPEKEACLKALFGEYHTKAELKLLGAALIIKTRTMTPHQKLMVESVLENLLIEKFGTLDPEKTLKPKIYDASIAILKRLGSRHCLTLEELHSVSTLLRGHSMAEINTLCNQTLAMSMTKPGGPQPITVEDLMNVYDENIVMKANTAQFQAAMRQIEEDLFGTLASIQRVS